MTKTESYPKEFVEWIRKNCTTIPLKKDRWWNFKDIHDWQTTCGTEALYEYWTKNIKEI